MSLRAGHVSCAVVELPLNEEELGLAWAASLCSPASGLRAGQERELALCAALDTTCCMPSFPTQHSRRPLFLARALLIRASKAHNLLGSTVPPTGSMVITTRRCGSRERRVSLTETQQLTIPATAITVGWASAQERLVQRTSYRERYYTIRPSCC